MIDWLKGLPVNAMPIDLHQSLALTAFLLVLIRIGVRVAVTADASANATVATRRRAHDAGFFIRRDGRAADRRRDSMMIDDCYGTTSCDGRGEPTRPATGRR